MAERFADAATDPSVDGALVAYHRAGAPGILVANGQSSPLPGTHPALGGGRLALIGNNVIVVRQTSGAPFAATIPAPGADAVAVSAQWVAWRARDADGDTIFAQPLGGGAARRVAKSAELGRPALEGGRIAYHVPGRNGSRIVIADLATGKRTTVRRERRAMLLNPSLHGGDLAYVRSLYRRQELRVGPQSKRTPRRDRRLWSTRPDGAPRRRPRAGQEAPPPRLAPEAVAAAQARALRDRVDHRPGRRRGVRRAPAPDRRPAAGLRHPARAALARRVGASQRRRREGFA